MKKITAKLPLTPFYDKDNVVIKKQNVIATLALRSGTHTYSSNATHVGTFKGSKIYATLTFTYHYDEQQDKFTIRGNEDISHEQLKIKTSLGQGTELSYYHSPNEVGLNMTSKNMWSKHVSQSVNFNELLAETARDCNKALVKAVINAGVDIVLEKGKPPVVTNENFNDFKLMFKEELNGKKEVDIEEIDRIQKRVSSTYVGTVTWSANKNFANVIGSTQDPLPSGTSSWLSLWRDKANNGFNTDKCSSLNYFSLNTTWTCTNVLVGGHVIPGTTASYMSKGSTVYIYPICTRHNGSDPNSMKSIYNPVGVQLNYW